MFCAKKVTKLPDLTVPNNYWRSGKVLAKFLNCLNVERKKKMTAQYNRSLSYISHLSSAQTEELLEYWRNEKLQLRKVGLEAKNVKEKNRKGLRCSSHFKR
jgi:hypothetical protein